MILTPGTPKYKTSEYVSWTCMKARCYTPSDKSYKNYGGRGIRVFSEWITSFESFLSHIGPKPSPAHTVERIEVNGHYEPGNVRWATRYEQNHNRRDNVVSDDLVREIRSARRGGETVASIASRLGLIKSRVSVICKGKAWYHVEGSTDIEVKRKPTEKQLVLLRFIQKHIDRTGTFPRNVEIVRFMGAKSKHAPANQLKALRSMGLLPENPCV